MKKLSSLLAFGIALVVLSTSVQSAPRKILVEIQTSTTCGPCYPADVFYFQNWLPNYTQSNSVATIAYHVWWPPPGNDPMYTANTYASIARVRYYTPTGTVSAPDSWIDGFIHGSPSYTSWPGIIDSRLSDPSPISITLSGTRNSFTLNMNASIHAEEAVNSTNWRIHWVVVQSGINQPQFSGSAYVPFVHDHVMRWMYPDENGMPIAISQGQTINVPIVMGMDLNWVPANCRVVVFVQNNTDKKVQNVEFINISSLTSVGNPINGIPTVFAISQNYPNPFNPTTTFDYAVSKQSLVSIKVYNLLGEEVRTLVSGEKGVGTYTVQWDGTNNAGSLMPSGMYLYKMSAGIFNESKKMIFIK